VQGALLPVPLAEVVALAVADGVDELVGELLGTHVPHLGAQGEAARVMPELEHRGRDCGRAAGASGDLGAGLDRREVGLMKISQSITGRFGGAAVEGATAEEVEERMLQASKEFA
jgi:hypothetical protein